MIRLILILVVSLNVLFAIPICYLDLDRQEDVSECGINSNNDEKTPLSETFSIDLFNAILQIGHIEFHSEFSFEFALPVEQNQKPHSIIGTALNYTKLYRTLFRLIISPNAP